MQPDPLKGRRVLVKLIMGKGDGHYPDRAQLTPEQLEPAYVVSCMSFEPSFEGCEHLAQEWSFEDDGLSSFREHGLGADWPEPVILVIAKRRVSAEEAEEIMEALWWTSYKLAIPGVNDDCPWFFEDHNGYSHVVAHW